MTRVQEIRARDDVQPDQRAAFDEIVGHYNGRVVGPFRVLLHSPEVARRIAHTGEYIRRQSPLPADVRELAVITTARELDCQYEWGAHEQGARRAGVPDAVIQAVRDRTAPEGFAEEHALVVSYVQELLRHHRVSERTFQAALQRLGVQQLTDLTATIGSYCLLACALNAFDVPSDGAVLPV